MFLVFICLTSDSHTDDRLCLCDATNMYNHVYHTKAPMMAAIAQHKLTEMCKSEGMHESSQLCSFVEMICFSLVQNELLICHYRSRQTL